MRSAAWRICPGIGISGIRITPKTTNQSCPAMLPVYKPYHIIASRAISPPFDQEIGFKRFFGGALFRALLADRRHLADRSWQLVRKTLRPVTVTAPTCDQDGGLVRRRGEKASFRLLSGFLPQRRAPAHKCRGSRVLRTKCCQWEAKLPSEAAPSERDNSLESLPFKETRPSKPSAVTSRGV